MMSGGRGGEQGGGYFFRVSPFPSFSRVLPGTLIYQLISVKYCVYNVTAVGRLQISMLYRETSMLYSVTHML